MNQLNSLGYKSESLDIKFEGHYNLLKYILGKYSIYNSQITRFITDNYYGISASSSWRKRKVPALVWNMIHKDLVILRMSGKDVKTLEELQEEFKFSELSLNRLNNNK